MVKGLVMAGGIAVGGVMELFEMQNGIQAVDVLLGLNVLVLTALWQLGREVSSFQAGLLTKATPREVRDEVKLAVQDALAGPRVAEGDS
jgi:hypothetical protein